MTNFEKVVAAALVVWLAVTAIFLYTNALPKPTPAVMNFGGAVNSPPISSLTYANYTSTSSAPTLIADATTARQYCVITNASANPAYLFINATSSIVTSSTAEKASYLGGSGGSYEIIVGEAYMTGKVWAINKTGTSSLSVGCNSTST